jgi:hypothetical protein
MPLLLCPRNRTQVGDRAISETCQQETHANAAKRFRRDCRIRRAACFGAIDHSLGTQITWKSGRNRTAVRAGMCLSGDGPYRRSVNPPYLHSLSALAPRWGCSLHQVSRCRPQNVSHCFAHTLEGSRAPMSESQMPAAPARPGCPQCQGGTTIQCITSREPASSTGPSIDAALLDCLRI